MLEFIESYFTQNFMGAESNTSYIAGMNFTNLLIAIPIIATILLMYFNCLRSKSAEHAINSVNDCKFISLTLIVYVPTFLIFTNLLGYQLSVCTIFIMILGYIPFVFLSSCICKEFCLQDGNQKLGGDNNSYAGEFTEKIKRKIQEIRNANKAKNILINGSWGAGKSHFIEKHLIPTQSLIYISCTDYADTHELISALIMKTNNCVFRWLFRLSISRLLAVLGKYELKEFIGVNKVIVFDEFERLFDYNKIDPMHIVSLIQYLNNQKNCICILVANEDHLNNASQFNNVREKLISYVYNYKIPFDEVIAIIQEEYLQDTKIDLEEKVEIVDLNSCKFDKLKQHFKYWYQIDNNIRMMRHLYIKINELYQATHQMVQEDDFYKERFKDINEINELFSGLFSYIDTVVIQLYYLYLKNPYFLTILEKFAGIYHDDTLAKTDKNNAGQNTQSIYFRKNSLQQLAAVYIERKDDQKCSDFILCFKEILSNEVFANVNQKLVTEYFEKSDFIRSFLNEGEIVPDGMRQNLEYFVRKFKEIICESDDPKSVISYFTSLNILQERFLQLIKDIKLPWNYSIVTDYIKYCQYLKEERKKRAKNHLSPKFLSASYDKVTYVNALIIQMILESKKTNIEQIVSEMNNLNKIDEFIGILNERTCLEIINENKTSELIELIKAIADKLNKQKYQQTILNEFIYSSYFQIQQVVMLHKYSSNEADKNEFNTLIEKMVNGLKESQQTPIKILQFMAKSYQDIKNHLHEAEIKKCNEKLIDLLTENKSKNFMMHLFVELSNFNSNDGFSESFPEDSLAYLVDTIKKVFNTQESLNAANAYIKQSIKGQIAKDVIAKLKEDLDKQNNQETE